MELSEEAEKLGRKIEGTIYIGPFMNYDKAEARWNEMLAQPTIEQLPLILELAQNTPQSVLDVMKHRDFHLKDWLLRLIDLGEATAKRDPNRALGYLEEAIRIPTIGYVVHGILGSLAMALVQDAKLPRLWSETDDPSLLRIVKLWQDHLDDVESWSDDAVIMYIDGVGESRGLFGLSLLADLKRKISPIRAEVLREVDLFLESPDADR